VKDGKFMPHPSWLSSGTWSASGRYCYVDGGKKKWLSSVHELREAGMTRAVLERLADADAFRSLRGSTGVLRLWHVSTKDYQRHALVNKPDHKRRKRIHLAGHVTIRTRCAPIMLLHPVVKAHPVSFHSSPNSLTEDANPAMIFRRKRMVTT